MYRSYMYTACVSVLLLGVGTRLQGQQSDVSLSPFVSLPSGGNTPAFAGLGLTLSGGGAIGLRGAGRLGVRNTYAGALTGAKWLPPWGADADAVFALSGRPFGARNRTASTFGFVGLGASARDTADLRLVAKNWSYGLGTVVPLGSIVDLFAESRWRLSRFVLPTAKPKPDRTKELRFGMSFHVAGVSGASGRRSR